jgi:hypothetical protein
MPHERKSTREPNYAAVKPTMDRLLAVNEEITRTSIEFLKTDVQTALTFSGIALESGNNEVKRLRNQRNARRSYDTVLRFLMKVPVNASDVEFLSSRLERLRSELEKLGESF